MPVEDAEQLVLRERQGIGLTLAFARARGCWGWGGALSGERQLYWGVQQRRLYLCCGLRNLVIATSGSFR